MLQAAAVRPQVANPQRRLAERDYVGRVTRVETHLDVAGECWHVVHAQAEEKGRRPT